MSASEIAERHLGLILDGTKIQWHQERIDQWARGERFAPLTIDLALTRACNYSCNYCFAQMQENERKAITKEVMFNFIDDCAEIGVKGISLVSDGESTLHPAFADIVVRGHEKGLSMASGTNAYLLPEDRLRRVMPALTYLRVNITAGEPERYKEIMGVKDGYFEKVCENIKNMMRIKRELKLKTTVGLQMVLSPQYGDQILPLTRLGKELGVDYLVIKHTSDDENGFLGVDYAGYPKLYDTLKVAELMSSNDYQVTVKWSKIKAEGTRTYEQCYGAPFLLQISGSGLIAPCGMLFGQAYKKFHLGNIVTDRFKDVYKSDRYWEVMGYLGSKDFNAKKSCGSLCLQHNVNEYLDGVKKGTITPQTPSGPLPSHLNFV